MTKNPLRTFIINSITLDNNSLHFKLNYQTFSFWINKKKIYFDHDDTYLLVLHNFVGFYWIIDIIHAHLGYVILQKEVGLS